MTARQRFLAALNGERPGGVPTLSLGPNPAADAVALPPTRLGEAAHDQAVFVEVLNPYGRARAAGVDLNAIFDNDPTAGQRALETFATGIEVDKVADGIFYRLVGASPDASTPMQYGGRYLELDREILSSLKVPVILWIEAPGSAYLDFVSDLPAQAFGWSARRTGIGAAAMRSMRNGVLLSDDPEADLRFEPAKEAARV